MSEIRPPDQVYRFGEFMLVADGPMLLRDGRRLRVTPRVLNVLLVLVKNAGRIVTKETLMREVWSDSFVEEGNLNRTVSRLRQALGDTRDPNRFVETVPRVGYRFIAEVELVDAASEAPAVESRQMPADGVAAKSPLGKILVPGVAVLLLALASYAVWYFWPRTQTAGDIRPPKQTPIRLTFNETREERPAFSPDGGSIRFFRWEGDTPVSFVMGADGTNQRREAAIPSLRTGTWSPDGKKVVFYKQGEDTQSVYLANSDGSNEIKLPFVAGNLDWSPDSSKLVYQFGKDSSNIYLYTLATGEISDMVISPDFDSDPTFSPDGNSVTFVSDRDGNAEIYIQNLDGSNLRRLTNHPAHDEFPTFSPDGTQIVFNSNREDENFDIYIMNLDGTAVRRLTNWRSDEEIRPGCWSADGTRLLFTSNKEGKRNIYMMEAEPYSPVVKFSDVAKNLSSPVYSPDGRRLAYVSDGNNDTGELHIMDLESKQDKLLYTGASTDMFPRFSPDGNSLVLQDRIGDNAEICLVSTDSGEVKNLSASPSRDVHPAWSPDGTKIIFTSNRDGNYDVYSLQIMNADGSNQHRVYYSNAISTSPSWSPDGTQVVFANDKEDNRSGNFEIFTIEPETVNPESRLTFHPRYDIQPVFSPDGRRIAFASNADGNMEIYMMNADGSAMVRLTRDVGDDSSPSWSPDGRRIIFKSDRSGRFAIYEIEI